MWFTRPGAWLCLDACTSTSQAKQKHLSFLWHIAIFLWRNTFWTSILKCKYFRCKRFFKTKADKEEHEKEEHQKLKCSYCEGHEYLFRQSLITHIQIKHKDKLIQCSFSDGCHNFFLNDTEKLEHIEKVHKSRAEEIECEICKQKLLRPHFNTHMRQFHDRSHNYTVSGETICCYCQEEFTIRKSAFKHVKEAHSKIETFKCYECEICFENVELKKEHYQKVHKGLFQCIYCANWKCSNRMNLRRHLRQKHQGEIIQCRYSNKCGLYFKTQYNLNKHIEESHEADKSSKLQCIYCKKFLPCNDLVKHMSIHHKSVTIKCNFLATCRCYFLTSKEREAHILEVHQPGVRSNELKCPCCPKAFLDFTQMKTHVAKSHLKSVLKCSLKPCKFVCTSLEILEKHFQKQHAQTKDLKKHRCLKCNFSSYGLTNFQNHTLRIHGEENLKCFQFCRRKFSSQSYRFITTWNMSTLIGPAITVRVNFLRQNWKSTWKSSNANIAVENFPASHYMLIMKKDATT